MKPAPALRSCAICTSLASLGAMEPLGRNDALVFVCVACSGEKPAARLGPERGYEPNGGMLNRKTSGKGARKVMGDGTMGVGRENFEAYGHTMGLRAVSPGHVLLRVAQPGARRIDRDEAERRLRERNPTLGAVNYLGADLRYHLFEAPTARVERDAVDPLEGLEQFKVST